MKIAGQEIYLPPEDVVVFPRRDQNLIFHIKGVASFEAFDAMYARPEPPKILKRGQQLANADDPAYQKQFDAWAQARQDWLLIEALSDDRNDIEWDQVVRTDPTTFIKVNDELKGIGLTQIELNRLINKVYEVNALSETGMENARANFLQMMSLGLPAG